MRRAYLNAIGAVCIAALAGVVSFLVVVDFSEASPAASRIEPQPPTVAGERLWLPAGFKDVLTFCDHGNRVYVTAISYGSTVAVVPADPSCATAVDDGEGIKLHDQPKGP
jgi:hypothetical protein